MTDAQRLWRWVGRHLVAAGFYCFRKSGATFTYIEEPPA